MPRSPVSTRRASRADIPALTALMAELSQVGGRAERAVNPVAFPDLDTRLGDALDSDECQVLIACADGVPAGMAVLRAVQPDPLSELRILQLMHLIVAKAHRRRGVGHALIAAAADVADELHLEHVSVGVYPSLRDASRFYARLGFAPVRVQRVAPVGVLRRRLATEPALARVDELVRRRTRLRRPLPAQRVSQPPVRETAGPAD